MADRAQIVVKGIVQGVGFRPFVFTSAESLGLKGYVTNTSEGVFIDVEGTKISEFLRRLKEDAPPLSRITDVSVNPLPFHGYSDFAIRPSADQGGRLPFTLISTDVSVCEDCLRELRDCADRRYLYPFINCTNCGPRYSITKSVPYDRRNTTMAGFTLCPDCLREYQDPRDRRFHAQPNACAACGPEVEFRARSAECGVKGGEAIKDAVKMLQNGGIVAVKGLGGFHIACDASNDAAVKRLREKKRKSNKPFAVMSPDVQTIRRYCEISDSEQKALLSNRRPIVLLHKRNDHVLPDSVSPNNNSIGCMLPYTPLHYLLFYHPLGPKAGMPVPHFQALVMTSGNLAEEPIVRDNDEAIKKLADVVDGFLLHNRDIFMRVDDSVVRVTNNHYSALRTPNSSLSFLRRSRGYAPEPIPLQDDGPEVLGCGADLKNTFTLTKGGFAIPSQHIGDMENYETIRFFEECFENIKQVYRVNPVAIGHDLHPGYLSTQWAVNHSELPTPNSELKRFGIQHHYAHIGSVMAEHGLTQKIIGVAFDGTGYGTDGNLWGAEFLIADIEGFERVGQFQYISLPGGEAAIREPWKTAVSCIETAAGTAAWDYLEQLGFVRKYGKDTLEKVMAIARSQELSPLASGAGRLFDAVSALLNICDRNTFEGEAAMALESFTREGIEEGYEVALTGENAYSMVDFAPAIIGIIGDLRRVVPKEIISTKFHNTVAAVILKMVRRLRTNHGLNEVALSGGTFQNLYLLNRTIRLLVSDGVKVFTNQKVPCNDGGISLGQAYLVRERLRKCGI